MCDVTWGWLSFLFLIKFWKLSSIVFLTYSLSSFLWDSKYIHISLISWYCPTGHWSSHHIFSNIFSLCASFWVISIDLSPDSWIFSSAVSNLLFLFNDYLKIFRCCTVSILRFPLGSFLVSMPLLKLNSPCLHPLYPFFPHKFLNIFLINPCLVIPTSGLSLSLLLFFSFDKCHVFLLLHISRVISLYTRYCRW